MTTVVMNKKDELIMRLVHYFVTEENYAPIIVNGVKDEIWLENNDGPYRIIRINSNNIFNREQLNYDYFKIKSIVKQIKKKTCSFKINTLNILLDVNEDLKLEELEATIKDIAITNEESVASNETLLEAFPEIGEKLLNDASGFELIMNVTRDINEKTEKENKRFESTFKKKKIVITPILMGICIVMLLISLIFDGINALLGVSNLTGVMLGANYLPLVKNGQIWRLVTCIFVHWSIIHLFVNMYSLRIIGSQIENFFGKVKYLLIFLVSGLCGSLLSLVIFKEHTLSAGASGAIFGLLGAMLYFGYHYRTYLGSVMKTQIIPVIVVNLGIGFLPGLNIDNACHIGGLFGGFLMAMALGVDSKSKKQDRINGIICLVVYIVALSYMIWSY